MLQQPRKASIVPCCGRSSVEVQGQKMAAAQIKFGDNVLSHRVFINYLAQAKNTSEGDSIPLQLYCPVLILALSLKLFLTKASEICSWRAWLEILFMTTYSVASTSQPSCWAQG